MFKVVVITAFALLLYCALLPCVYGAKTLRVNASRRSNKVKLCNLPYMIKTRPTLNQSVLGKALKER